MARPSSTTCSTTRSSFALWRANKRFDPVRKYLFNALVSFATCAGAGCRAEIPPEPLPLPEAEAEAEEAGREEQAAALAPATISGDGALAKLAKAPASKVGDSRFESWVPRFDDR